MYCDNETWYSYFHDCYLLNNDTFASAKTEIEIVRFSRCAKEADATRLLICGEIHFRIKCSENRSRFAAAIRAHAVLREPDTTNYRLDHYQSRARRKTRSWKREAKYRIDEERRMFICERLGGKPAGIADRVQKRGRITWNDL